MCDRETIALRKLKSYNDLGELALTRSRIGGRLPVCGAVDNFGLVSGWVPASNRFLRTECHRTHVILSLS
jgi:hypothetical protein